MTRTTYFCTIFLILLPSFDALFIKNIHNKDPNKQNIKPRNKPEDVSAQRGSKALLKCKMGIRTGNITVSWKKSGSESPLTDNLETLSDDKRFMPIQEGKYLYQLLIRFTKETDSGVYECHVTNGRNSSTSLFNLTVIRAYAEILGEKLKRPKADAPLRLSCLLHHSIEEPDYIFWYKNDRVINYDLEDGATVREGPKGSELIFPRAEASHSGNYSCVPSNADQVSVIVEVEPKTKV